MSPHRITPAFLIAAGLVAVAACTAPAASAPPPTASSGPSGPKVCMAVGDGTTAFAELWNGSGWRLLSTP